MNLAVESQGLVGLKGDHRAAALVRRLEAGARAAVHAARRAMLRHVRSPDEMLARRLEEWTFIGLVNSGRFF